MVKVWCCFRMFCDDLNKTLKLKYCSKIAKELTDVLASITRERPCPFKRRRVFIFDFIRVSLMWMAHGVVGNLQVKWSFCKWKVLSCFLTLEQPISLEAGREPQTHHWEIYFDCVKLVIIYKLLLLHESSSWTLSIQNLVASKSALTTLNLILLHDIHRKVFTILPLLNENSFFISTSLPITLELRCS